MPQSIKRILVKFSGEALAPTHSRGVFDHDILTRFAHDLCALQRQGIQVCAVLGGGNILRGQSLSRDLSLDRPTSDALGMLATVMNGVIFAHALKEAGGNACVMSAREIMSCVPEYTHTKAIEALNQGGIPVFVGGTGNAFFSTDTTAALRALEVECDCVIKVTNVDGVYSQDPKKHKDAVFYARLDYAQAISENLRVMDATAFTLLKEHHMPLIVCSALRTHDLFSMINGRGVCTHIS